MHHDRVYQALDVSIESSIGLRAMAANAESLLQIMEGGDTKLAQDTATAAVTPTDENQSPVAQHQLSHRVQEAAGAARAQSVAVDDVARQLNQIAALIVQNREDVQSAWAATQQLEKTAAELEALVRYFE